MKSLNHVQLFATPWTAAYQAPPSMGFSRQEYWSWVSLPSPNTSRDHFKKESRENILKYPPIYYQIHTPIDLGMAMWEVQGGSRETVGERKRRVLAREKELTVSCKLCITRCVTNTFHAL